LDTPKKHEKMPRPHQNNINGHKAIIPFDFFEKKKRLRPQQNNINGERPYQILLKRKKMA